MSATQVKNFDFDNDTSKNMFLLSYITYMANERPQGEEQFHFKGALSGLRHFWQLKALSKWKNAFYFTSKALFVLKIFKFLSWLFGHVSKRLDKKDKVNFKIYDVTTAWLTNNRNAHIAQYFKK